MFFRAPFSRSVVRIGFALATVPAWAQLAAKSPFLTPQSAGSAPTAGAPIEFRAMMTTSEGTLFRIYDPTRKVGTWIKLNERNAEFDVTIKQYEEQKKALTIEYQGKSLTLAEREPKVVSSGSAAQVMPPPATPSNVAPAVTQSVVLNPTPADEQRRLDAVAAEVARRRALREQASQQMGPGGTMQPMVQPPLNIPPPQQNMPVPGAPSFPRGRGPQPGAPRQQ